MAAPDRDIRGVLISVHQGRLLLPNASVAEVIRPLFSLVGM